MNELPTTKGGGIVVNRPTATVPRSPTPLPQSSRLDMILPLLSQPSRIRNVCILAHVDHGKTTMTDSLLASNGIISFKQAGLLRYLDFREDEQERGITMESSAITLLFDDKRNSEGSLMKRYVMNLIDSPGHIDFAGHVFTASRLCDGAAVLVDAVEGVCTQTMAVLRQARRERLTLILVINKMDRLVSELKLEPNAAALWLFKLLEQMNAIYGSIDKEQGQSYFDPVGKGNVVFASATDGWAFTLHHFAHIYSQKLSMDKSEILANLWGANCSFDSKSKRFSRIDEASGKMCSFAQLVLHNIWAVYNARLEAERSSIIKTLKLQIPERELRSGDADAIIKTILSSWLPLFTAIFHTVIDCIPDPQSASTEHLEALIPLSQQHQLLKHLHDDEQDLTLCQVAKMFSVVKPADIQRAETSATDSSKVLIGMARLFKGKLQVGQKVYILGPKYDPDRREGNSFFEYTVDRLYLLMGRDLMAVDCVHSGCVFGICGGGLEKLIFKSGTIASSLDCIPLNQTVNDNSTPLLLRVAVHPVDIVDLEALQHGLQTLCQADPCAETYIQSNGEQVLAVTGELHLEMCLKDLRERFTNNLQFHVSSPLVPFKETFQLGQRNRLDFLWKDMLCDVCVVEESTGLLHVNLGYSKFNLKCISSYSSSSDHDDQSLMAIMTDSRNDCILFKSRQSVDMKKSFESSLCAGFKLATDSGPLCNEPTFGVKILITHFNVDPALAMNDEPEICGRLITDFCSSCHSAMLYWSPRLQLATYSCDVQTLPDYLGRAYGVLSRRKGRIISEDYNETTGFFTIHSHIPVIESFGFGGELRSKTSGIAVPQLIFSGFETLDVDPFAIDDDDGGGGGGDDGEGENGMLNTTTQGRPNDAMRYLMAIRERKGMFVERRIVECADKQRTRRK